MKNVIELEDNKRQLLIKELGRNTQGKDSRQAVRGIPNEGSKNTYVNTMTLPSK